MPANEAVHPATGTVVWTPSKDFSLIEEILVTEEMVYVALPSLTRIHAFTRELPQQTSGETRVLTDPKRGLEEVSSGWVQPATNR